MDVTMRVHQLLARSALVLALVHPFLYTLPSQPPYPWDPTRQLTLSDDITALSSGIAAWLLLPAFVALAISRTWLPYRYEIWRLTHGLGAFLIAGLTLHHARTAGRYSQDPALASLWTILAAIALLAIIYVYVIEPLHQRGRPWVVTSVKQAALKTWELSLEPVGHRGLDYDAGQFVWLNLGNSVFSLRENPFSLSSAPAAGPGLKFIVKELGDLTSRIGETPVGTRAYIDGPHGHLTLVGRTEPGIVLIAGGVGIAPMLGILEQLHLEGDTRPTVLLYANRVADQIVNSKALEHLTKSHGTELIHVVSEPWESWTGRTGRIDSSMIRELFAPPDRKSWLYVLCGPPPMLEVIEDALIEIGVPADRILSERFTYD